MLVTVELVHEAEHQYLINQFTLWTENNKNLKLKKLLDKLGRSRIDFKLTSPCALPEFLVFVHDGIGDGMNQKSNTFKGATMRDIPKDEFKIMMDILAWVGLNTIGVTQS